MSAAKKELKKVIRIIKKQGWEVSGGGCRHIRVVSPEGEMVFLPSSPGRGRAMTNAMAALRRKGADL